jgi:hypothetical protein
MELAAGPHRDDCGGLTVAEITHVFTIGYVAEMLGEDEDWLSDIAIDMDPEDGRLWVYGVGEDGVTAFTDFGIENLKQLVADLRADGRAPPPKPKTT